MKETTVTAWCDMCAHKRERVAAVTMYRIGLCPDSTWDFRTLDLCVPHTNELNDLRGVVVEYGEPIEQQPPGAKITSYRKQTPARMLCPECDRQYATDYSLSTHILTVHLGKSLAEAIQPQPSVCPDCGFDGNGRSIAQHRKNQHNWNRLDEVLIEWADKGEQR